MRNKSLLMVLAMSAILALHAAPPLSAQAQSTELEAFRAVESSKSTVLKHPEKLL